jgi:hypothetical protein
VLLISLMMDFSVLNWNWSLIFIWLCKLVEYFVDHGTHLASLWFFHRYFEILGTSPLCFPSTLLS